MSRISKIFPRDMRIKYTCLRIPGVTWRATQRGESRGGGTASRELFFLFFTSNETTRKQNDFFLIYYYCFFLSVLEATPSCVEKSLKSTVKSTVINFEQASVIVLEERGRNCIREDTCGPP